MLEILVEQQFYVTAVLLFSIGFATLLLHPNLIKKIIGLNLMDTAARGADAAAYIKPVPGGLVLTGMVVAVSTTALFLALTHRLYQKYHSVNLDVILMLARRGTEEE